MGCTPLVTVRFSTDIKAVTIFRNSNPSKILEGFFIGNWGIRSVRGAR